MKAFQTFMILICFNLNVLSQEEKVVTYQDLLKQYQNDTVLKNEAQEISTKDLETIISETNTECDAFKKKIEKEDYLSDVEKQLIMQFRIDTLRIELVEAKKMKIDYTTSGMSNTINESTKQYDKLLNAYYQRLAIKLKTADKEFLKQAQRNWISFRDSEIKLMALLNGNTYSGGGSISTNINSIEIKELTKKRGIDLYLYLLLVSTSSE
jgi:uncharacterized protein YecT (DUF1311 family)